MECITHQKTGKADACAWWHQFTQSQKAVAEQMQKFVHVRQLDVDCENGVTATRRKTSNSIWNIWTI